MSGHDGDTDPGGGVLSESDDAQLIGLGRAVGFGANPFEDKLGKSVVMGAEPFNGLVNGGRQAADQVEGFVFKDRGTVLFSVVLGQLQVLMGGRADDVQRVMGEIGIDKGFVFGSAAGSHGRSCR